MATLHGPCVFTRGDTWKIAGTLYNADGTPFVLSGGAVLNWRLVDASGATVLDLSSSSGAISFVDAPNGLCLITVHSDQSDDIAPGMYSDQLRATGGGGDIDTLWTGSIEVRKSLFVP